MKLLGEHNYENICGALTALDTLNIDIFDIKQEYFDEFEPIEHRLETINRNGILFVNDSISTIPEAAIACYKTFNYKNIYGILGGFDRQQNYEDLVNYVIQNTNIKFLTLLGKTGTRIAEILKQHSFNNFLICTTLEECVKNLYGRAKHDNNSVIILSPASASYDMYKNFEERGNDFKKIIEELK